MTEITPAPIQGPEAPPVPPEAYGLSEIQSVLKRPDRAVEFVLGRPDRIASTVGGGKHLWPLSLLLLLSGLAFAVPFGAVPPVSAFWKISILYTGSVALCYPCLHVFSCYLGFRLASAQNLALGLLVSAVAAIFTFGFFPILWFIHLTLTPTAAVRPEHLHRGFLGFSLLLAIAHLGRCLRHLRGAARMSGLYLGLLIPWVLLLVFMTYRMGILLGLI